MQLFGRGSQLSAFSYQLLAFLGANLLLRPNRHPWILLIKDEWRCE